MTLRVLLARLRKMRELRWYDDYEPAVEALIEELEADLAGQIRGAEAKEGSMTLRELREEMNEYHEGSSNGDIEYGDLSSACGKWRDEIDAMIEGVCARCGGAWEVHVIRNGKLVGHEPCPDCRAKETA